MTFVIRRPNGVARKLAGYHFKKAPAKTKRYAVKIKKCPASVDLRSYMPPVEDHGEVNSAVANAAAAAYEYTLRRHVSEETYSVSRLFVYYNARAARGAQDEDDGATISDAIKSLTELGACSRTSWPYSLERVLQKPPEDAYAQAKKFRIETVRHVPTKLDCWRSALAEGYPIIFGLRLSAWFDRQRQPGMVPFQKEADGGLEHGEHAMLCVGYADGDEVFIVRNSWGPAWGDQGYCYIPYEQMMSADHNPGDAWVIGRKKSFEIDEATWSTSGSVIEEHDSDLGRMDDDAWLALLDSLGDVALETRLALIFLAAAGINAQTKDPDIANVMSPLEAAFQHLGCPFDADKVLREAMPLIQEEALVDDSIVLIGDHFEEESLVAIVKSAADAGDVDDLSGVEEGVLADLVDAWLGGAAPRAGALVDGLPGEYDDVDYADGVYGDDDNAADDFSDGFGEV